MTSHKAKVALTKIIIVLATAIYVASFFYTGFTGFAVIGTSVQIIDLPNETNSTDFGGVSSGTIIIPNFFTANCGEQVILSQQIAMIIDTTTTSTFCVASKDIVFSDPYSFSSVQVLNLKDLVQVTIISYPLGNRKIYFLIADQDMKVNMGRDLTVYLKSVLMSDVQLNTSNFLFFKETTPAPQDSLLILSLDKPATLPPKVDTLESLVNKIVDVKNNITSQNQTDSPSLNESLAYLLQQIQVVELDENDRVINKTTISLSDLPTYSFGANTKRIAIHWENADTPWLVFSRSVKDFNALANSGENYTLQEYSKEFLLETQNAKIVPSQLQVFRTTLLGVVSVGFLSLHNLSLRKPEDIA